MLVIIITTYLQCLGTQLVSQFLSQQTEQEYHILLVNNNLPLPLELNIPNVTVLNTTENLHYLRSNNLGIDWVNENIPDFTGILFCNDDIFISRDFLNNIKASSEFLDYFQPAYDDPAWTHLLPPKIVPALCYESTPLGIEVPVIDGACMYASREVIKNVGKFDTDIGIYSWGDGIDYALMTHQAGFKVGVTYMCYYNHLNHFTQTKLSGSYIDDASKQMHSFLLKKWGIRNWNETFAMIKAGILDADTIISWSKPEVAIVTACSRLTYLDDVYESVKNAKKYWQVKWIIVADDAKEGIYDSLKSRFQDPWIVVNKASDARSIYGNAQRDKGIELCANNEYMYFLDDDNIILEEFAKETALELKRGCKAVVVTQGENWQANPLTGLMVAKKENCAPDKIDLAQFIVKRNLLCRLRFMNTNKYNSDGCFLKAIWDAHSNGFVFLNPDKMLTIYNGAVKS